ncbi:MAG: nucleotidyltransferase domain-containing protein [Nanoarchaeota archaeon]|nr:nucleotidyltransferase domain-containing protein [Nanoarchaeota archaeon]
MIKKCYEYGLIEQLRKQPAHLRELARSCCMNQMAVLRSMAYLETQNVVDFRREGKNKVYFLKNTLEARRYLYLTEHFKLLACLSKYPRLRPIMQWIEKNKKIKMAIIFGSYAKGTVHGESDIDLYLETKNRKIKEELSKGDSKLSITLGQFQRDTPLGKEIEKYHLIIKGVERYYETIFTQAGATA